MQFLSTTDVPARERLDFLHDFVARYIAGMHFRPAEEQRFAFALSAYALGDGVTVGTARYSDFVNGQRTSRLAADGRDNYLLTIHDADHEVSADRGGRIAVPAGDMTIVNEGTTTSFDLPGTVVRVVSLNRRWLERVAPCVRSRPIHHIRAAAPGAGLLRAYVDLLRAEAPEGDEALRLAGSHLHDLVALVLRGSASEVSDTARSSLSAARLELVKAEIRRCQDDPELDLAAVARRQGISPRYIQRLFGQEGATFSDFLRDVRLDAAFDALQRASSRETTISAIAFDVGFSDLSSFYRAFRKRFGATPRDIRAAAMRRDH